MTMGIMINFLKADNGATAVEYALIASGIAAVIAVVVFSLGKNVNQLFENYNQSYPD